MSRAQAADMRPRLFASALTGGALVLLRPPIAAAAPAPRQVTLAEALAYARAHQPDLRAAAERVEAARAGAAIARSHWYPAVTGAAEVLAGTTNNTTGSYLAVGGFDNPRVSATRAASSASASLDPEPSSLLGLGLRQEVFDFGRISAAAAAEDLRSDVARFSAAGERLVVDFRVEEAFFAVYAAKAVVAAASSASERARIHRDEAKAGFDAGMRRPIELTRAEAVLDRYLLAEVRASRDVTVAESVLAAAVGVPDRLLDISGTPPSFDDFPSLDVAMSAASERNPDLAAALASVKAQEQESRAIASENRPNLVLSAALSGNAGGASPSSGDIAEARGLLPVVPNWDVGLVLAWPIVDETVRARVRQSRITEQERRDEADGARQRLNAAVEQSYAAVEAARDALPLLKRALDAAIANYQQATARFDAGLGNAVELADAEELRVAAEIELAAGRFELARTRAILGRYMAEVA
jgi:outer membrane protein